MTAPRVPEFVTHDELLAATTPLFELLNVSVNEVVGDINIIQLPDGARSDYSIRFHVVASPDDVLESEMPEEVAAKGHPQGVEFNVFTHAIEVGVVYA